MTMNLMLGDCLERMSVYRMTLVLTVFIGWIVNAGGTIDESQAFCGHKKELKYFT